MEKCLLNMMIMMITKSMDTTTITDMEIMEKRDYLLSGLEHLSLKKVNTLGALIK